MKNIKHLKALIFFSAICLFTNCTPKIELENQEAKELVIQAKKLPIRYSINIGLRGGTGGLNALQNEGLITYEMISYGAMSMRPNSLNLTPTDKGKEFYLGKDANSDTYNFKTYDIDLNEITGIAINQEDQTATIRFTTKAINVTIVATVLARTRQDYFADPLDQQINNELVFKKFDNGWQLK